MQIVTLNRFMNIHDTFAVLSNKSEELHEVYIESIMQLHGTSRISSIYSLSIQLH